MTERTFDIVLWGATGFTGALTAEVLAERYAGVVRVALGGRNRKKLEKLRDDLGVDWELVIGDAFDPESLDAMTASTKVVATTVGPYCDFGKELVASCVRNGTHYCDLTGEVEFVREMIDLHHDAARESGARIVHFSGFDSIPSDIGAFHLQQVALERFGAPCERVHAYVAGSRGGVSGGTIATMRNTIEKAGKDKSLRRLLFDPYALNPEGERTGPDGRDLMSVEYDEVVKSWIGPWVMASINTRVVRRSNALLDYAYGKDFGYTEVMKYGDGLAGRAKATATTAGLGLFAGGMSMKPTRAILDKVLPDAGEGPSDEVVANGFFKLRHVGLHGDDRITVEVWGRRDPGYGATASMLSAAAVCLALDAEELPSEGGILTPASAMGSYLVDRLNADGEVTVREV